MTPERELMQGKQTPEGQCYLKCRLLGKQKNLSSFHNPNSHHSEGDRHKVSSPSSVFQTIYRVIKSPGDWPVTNLISLLPAQLNYYPSFFRYGRETSQHHGTGGNIMRPTPSCPSLCWLNAEMPREQRTKPQATSTWSCAHAESHLLPRIAQEFELGHYNLGICHST